MKTAVVLTTLGGPRSLEEVPEFVKNFIGRELPPPAVKAIVERYRAIGGASPLARITEHQAEKLNDMLGDGYLCLPAFRHVRPSIEDAIDKTAACKVTRILFLILSPFYTATTTGNYLEAAKAHIKKIALSVPVGFIHSWCREPRFIECWAEKIKKESFDEDAFYIFSAHSLPLKYSDEPYRGQIEETVKAVASLARVRRHALAWQSIPANAPEPWITPVVEEKIAEAAAAGFRSIVQVPVGFTADHIETLYDIDITHREYALARGIGFRRISSLNDDDLFIRALKEIVLHFTNSQKDEK